PANTPRYMAGWPADPSRFCDYRRQLVLSPAVDNVLQETSTANGGDRGTLNYTGTTLAEGTHAFTATATANSKTSTETGPFLVGVDLTAPTVTVNAEATTYTKAPLVRVTATDQNLAATTTFT